MWLISTFNKGIRFLLCVIDIYSKHALVLPLKDKKCIAIEMYCKESNRKPNKIWVKKGSEFYNSSMKSLLKNDIKTYSTHNEGNSVVSERFIIIIRPFKKIHKYMTSISKSVYIDKLDDIVNKYNNRYHITIKMKSVDIKPTTCIDSSK